MGTKNDHGKFDCYDKAMIDEPMFVLLARDPHAPTVISAWARMRFDEIQNGTRPQSDLEMVNEAMECTVAMRVWREKNDGKWRNVTHNDAPPFICEDGIINNVYERTYNGAVLCYAKDKVICIWCNTRADGIWPVTIEFNGHVFYPRSAASGPTSYNTQRGDSVRTAS